MSQQFDLEIFCTLCEKYKPQRAHLNPRILVELANNPIVDKYDLSSLTMIVCATETERLSKNFEEAVNQRIGAEVKQVRPNNHPSLYIHRIQYACF
jgi:acyl-coenzyme A synthetase/AMP-(fatty) acid ligase